MQAQLAKQQESQLATANYSTAVGLEIMNQRFNIIAKEAERLSKCSYLPDTLKGKQDDCAILIELAITAKIPPFLLAQEMYVVHNRFAFSSKFIIAQIQKVFPDLNWEYFGDVGDTGEIERKPKLDAKGNPLTDSKNNPIYETGKIIREGRACVAYATRNGQRIEGPRVSMAMAKAEGWYDKNGSKWQTMPEVMLRYRAACFFKNFYCPDVMLGIKSVEEEHDIIDPDLEIQEADGTWKKATPFSRVRAKRTEKVEQPTRVEKSIEVVRDSSNREPETEFVKEPTKETPKAEKVETPQKPPQESGREEKPEKNPEVEENPISKLKQLLSDKGLTLTQCKNYCRRNGMLAGGKVDEFAAQKLINGWNPISEFIAKMPLEDEGK